MGFVAVESRKSEKLPIGTVAIDAAFSPVTKANFSVENMRVGDRTDYNRLRLTIETDGSITPSQALRKSARILQDFFAKVGAIEATESERIEKPLKKPAKKAGKTAKGKKAKEAEKEEKSEGGEETKA